MAESERTRRNAEREKLKQAIAVAKTRGIEIPKDILDKLENILPDYTFKRSESGWFTGGDNRVFKPNSKQLATIESNSRYLLLCAGRGSGKTATMAQKSILKLEAGLPGIIANPDFENLKISTWPEFRSWLDPMQIVPKQRHRLNPEWQPTQPFTLNLNNGSWCIIKGIKDPDSARGPNVNWFWYDEPARGSRDGEDWKIANASVRIGKNPQAFASGTPDGKDHWLYKFFIQQEIPQEALDEFKKLDPTRELVETIFTSIEDNRDNLDPAYYASMIANYPEGWLRRQELYGEFVDRGGTLGNREWFKDKIIPGPLENPDGLIRFWDLAATEKKLGAKFSDPDETVGTRMSYRKEGIFCIEDQVAGCWAWDEIKKRVIDTAFRDGFTVPIVFEQEPASGGINQVAELTSLILSAFPGFRSPIGWRPVGDKVLRANVWFAEAASGKMLMSYGDWNNKFLDQLSSFPVGRHDDRIDSISGARHNLAPIITWRNTTFLKL